MRTTPNSVKLYLNARTSSPTSDRRVFGLVANPHRLQAPTSVALADGIPFKGFEGASAPFPSAEKLSYDIEWRLIYAGSAHLSLAPKPGDPRKWDSQLRIESGGLVSKLYRLKILTTSAWRWFLHSGDAAGCDRGQAPSRYQSGLRSHPREGQFVERDLDKNAVIKSRKWKFRRAPSMPSPASTSCAWTNWSRAKAQQVPMSDGKKTAYVRVEAQGREQVKIKAGTFETIRYEVSCSTACCIRAKADLFVWLTDDAHRLPVQIRARMSFPVGTITFELTKDEHP